MIILALDLGKFNTMCCFFDTQTRKPNPTTSRPLQATQHLIRYLLSCQFSWLEKAQVMRGVGRMKSVKFLVAHSTESGVSVH